MVDGEHEPVFRVRGADQRGAKRRAVAELSHRGAFVRGQLLELFVDVAAVEFEVAPSHFGFGRDDLHRLAELGAEAGGQVRVAGDDGVQGTV
ncbi:hypothetical protein PICSAR120_04297 [Mycobacterium avium subsp. paratuberculosis]|nr:hypothetical protein PICSAR120_04297 [Mycobacterium avium subsp. paratuberculosis]CAG6934298.1 hypothetical protein PICSAR107_04320 [Mycobacterium avium subsp. paratuberculosis]